MPSRLPYSGTYEHQTVTCDRCGLTQTLEEYNSPNRHMKGGLECNRSALSLNPYLAAQAETTSPSASLPLPMQSIHTSTPASAPVVGSLIQPAVPTSVGHPMGRRQGPLGPGLLDVSGRDSGRFQSLPSPSYVGHTVPRRARGRVVSAPPQEEKPRKPPLRELPSQEGLPFRWDPANGIAFEGTPGLPLNSAGQPDTSDLSLGEVIYRQAGYMANARKKPRREKATVLPYRSQSDQVAAVLVMRVLSSDLMRKALAAHDTAGNIERNCKVLQHFLYPPFKDYFPEGQNTKNVQKAAHRMVNCLEYILNIWKVKHDPDQRETLKPRPF